jgi:hypothetical protein
VRTGCLKGGAVAYQSGSVIFGDTCKSVLLFATLYEKVQVKVNPESFIHSGVNPQLQQKIDYNIYRIIWGEN